MTKERPILFKGEMVRAILDGRKTQTRRVVKPQAAVLTDEMARALGVQPPAVQNPPVIPCPYGAPGDRLWVRETYAAFTQPTHEYGEADLIEGPLSDAVERYGSLALAYKADGTSNPERWRPSIFMPRSASRILLEITDERVQRLQEISEEDARAEGIRELSLQEGQPGAWWTADPQQSLQARTPVQAFRRLWESIHGADSWDVDPWVWAISFMRLQP